MYNKIRGNWEKGKITAVCGDKPPLASDVSCKFAHHKT